MTQSLVRLGLIGAGKWGRAYIRTVNSLPDVCLARLCSSNPKSSKLVPGGCHITNDWRSLLGCKDLDGLIIATPPALHAQMLLESLEAGLPVMVEKPMAVTLEEAIQIRKAVVSTGLPVLVDHTHLFQPAYRRLKQIAQDIGPVRTIRSIGGQYVKAQHDISPLWDYGPHDVALSVDFMKQAPLETKVTSRANTIVENGPGEIVNFNLEFANGVVSSITVGNAMPDKRRLFAVQFEEETFVINDLAKEKLVRYSDLKVHDLEHESLFQFLDKTPAVPIPTENDLPLTKAMKEFANGIRTPLNLPPSFGVEVAVEVTKVLEACQNDKE